VSVEHALYGLMLPSGNDAAQALSEWGGKIIRSECNKYFQKSFDEIGKKKTNSINIAYLLNR